MVERVEPLIRKTVTVLFCDVTGSTSLGERIDPETLRRVMLEYFDEMRAAIERHGGTVEKFIGDAVMAVFGVPVVHEDDALRAVRAGDEMRGALVRLNNDLDSKFGVRLEMRIGINTGEVVVGDPTAEHLIATGDAVNVAARLQQAAQPGEILLGRETHRLVADRIRAGPLESFSLKGKSEAVPTWRLDEVRAGAEFIFRRLDSPLVGREQERDFLRDAYRTVIEDQSCRLVTVLGAAGVGKSRLAQEVAARSFGAAVAQGRCLSYGEGITFFPIAEVVRSLAGITADDNDRVVKARVGQLLPPGDEAAVVTERLVSLLSDDGTARADEVFWAVRKLLEVVARSRPLVLLLEDLHWAEPTLLDLIEYLVGWSHGSPMLVLALARPELLELRPGWPGDRLILEPLDGDDVHALLGNLLGSAELDPAVAANIERAADGNPLFVEELVRMLVDDGTLLLDDGRWVASEVGELRIPPSINALLAARLDRLEPEEQTVIQCASVIGKQFWWRAVVELAPPELASRVGSHLHALVRKRLVFPAEPASFVSEDSFRFGHILVRDAAYAAMPKATRAILHQRFAAWLESKGGQEEFRGHHLEQAYTARCELGPPDDETRALGERAAMLLASAGRRAFARDDLPAARTLLERAAALPLDPAAQAETLLELGVALRWTGEQARAATVLDDALEHARALGDERLAARVEIEESTLRAMTDPRVSTSELAAVAEEASVVFRTADDDVGLAKAWILLAEAHWIRGSCGDMERVLEDALHAAERGGAERELRWVMRALMRGALLGPRRVEDAILRCRELQERGRGDAALSANGDSMLAVLEAMRGAADEARRLYGRSKRTLEEAGLKTMLASLQMYAGMAELVSGDALAAERELRLGYGLLDDMGEQDRLSTTAAYLARALVAQERFGEADLVARVSEASASEDDLASQVIVRGTRARIVARSNDIGSAEHIARHAVELSRKTDLLGIQGDALVDLADVCTVIGKPQDATSALAEAAALYQRKGNAVCAARALGVYTEPAATGRG
jgi:class 3 adenylate cyclase/tetratricopeptide (TPR) repeat protein